MTTKATPLSAVKIILLLSFFNSFMAVYSSLVIFAGGLCAFVSTFLTSTLNSSASPWFNLGQACSIAAMYSHMGGCLGLITNFGPWAIFVSGMLDKFLTHLDVFSALSSAASLIQSLLVVVLVAFFEWPPMFEWSLVFC